MGYGITNLGCEHFADQYSVDCIGHYQAEIINQLTHYAIDTLGADLILPLDADEFLYSMNELIKPRDVLENLIENIVFSAGWRNFIPDDVERNNNVFLPSYFTKFFNDRRTRIVNLRSH